METLVIVVAAEGWDLQAVAHTLRTSHQVFLTEGRYLEVSQATSSAYVCVMDPWEEGLFEDWPEELIPKGHFAAFSIDYRNPALMESIVREISAKANVAVDTNFGDVMSGGAFVARVDRSEPRWEWWHWPRDLNDSSS
ncbi:hypothetical protein ACFCZ1_25650 [Streptomyces sp. NPDC056224]|uniref:hypothetical protein n=1 Tax=Streptomyces sp. NPDC056224 TaxID=3345750 RepID=UPI0035DE2CFA